MPEPYATRVRQDGTIQKFWKKADYNSARALAEGARDAGRGMRAHLTA